MISRILLDMDGPLVNFVGGACRIHRVPELESEVTDWDMASTLGLSTEELLSPIWGNMSFWANLRPYDHAIYLYKTLLEIAPVTLCTSPLYKYGLPDGACVRGKAHWAKKVLGVSPETIIFTSDKSQLAHPNAMLIDDKVSNVQSFNDNAGWGLLFARPWNSNSPYRLSVEGVIKTVSVLANLYNDQ
jgi:hypothetical protein